MKRYLGGLGCVYLSLIHGVKIFDAIPVTPTFQICNLTAYLGSLNLFGDLAIQTIQPT